MHGARFPKPRLSIANWLASAENPYFAKNLSNIVWNHFFGQGIVNEVDDVRISNPASNQELLDELGKRFTAYRYDFKKLVKDICTSATYQRSTLTTKSNEGDTRMTIRLRYDGRTIEKAATIPSRDERKKEPHLYIYESGITFLLNVLQRETPELFA